MNKIKSHNNKKKNNTRNETIIDLKCSLKNKNILDTICCFLINWLLCPRRWKLYHSGKKNRKKRDASSNIISFKFNSERYLFFHDFIKSRKNINCHLTPILSRLISLMNHARCIRTSVAQRRPPMALALFP